MSQGMFFDTGGAREFNESDSQQQQALLILRHRKLTKVSFEQDMQKDGCRLAPAIEVLRNGWGFKIAGSGAYDDPYWLLDKKQSPSRVRATEEIKLKYYASTEWTAIREQRYKHDNYRCVLCVGSCKDELQCHHVRYNLFSEKLDELMTVCNYHHTLIHDNCFLKFPTGVELWIAERLLGVIAYPFEEWLLP